MLIRNRKLVHLVEDVLVFHYTFCTTGCYCVFTSSNDLAHLWCSDVSWLGHRLWLDVGFMFNGSTTACCDMEVYPYTRNVVTGLLARFLKSTDRRTFLLIQRLRILTRPTPGWGPAEEKYRAIYKYRNDLPAINGIPDGIRTC